MQTLEFPFATPAPGTLSDISPDIKWLRMPLPFALDHINLYLIRDGAGWLIVDTGMDNATSREIWQTVFAQLPPDEPITGLLCTHSHTDHAGASAWLTRTLRIPLLMSAGEFFWMHTLAGGTALESWEYARFYQRLGLSEEQTQTMLASLRNPRFNVELPHAYQRVREGDTLALAGADWRVITGSGHSPEHISLYSETHGVLICGDQLLPRISANVSVSAVEPESDPLRTWLDATDRVGALPPETLVLPAHHLPYRGLRQRAAELRAHHHQKLSQLREHCVAQPGSASDLARMMFPLRRSPLDDFLALGECLAHLHHLVADGLIRRELRADGVYRFEAIG